MPGSGNHLWRQVNTGQVYLTNGTPTESGLNTRIGSSNSFTVTQPGIQQLPVSAEHPLTLFDLVVTLDWDASHDPAYLSQLEFDLKRAPQHLYDFTDGQVAMRKIAVNQNGDFSDSTHILVHVTNRLRPHAVSAAAGRSPVSASPEWDDSGLQTRWPAESDRVESGRAGAPAIQLPASRRTRRDRQNVLYQNPAEFNYP